MRSTVARLVGALMLLGVAPFAQAQDAPQAPIPFEGGQLTITESDEGDKVIAFGGTVIVIVWKPRDAGIQATVVGGDCGGPAAAVTAYNIYFVPWLLPGASDTVQSWTPDSGLEVVGTISYAPQPGTGWSDVEASKYQNIVDSLKNEAVYNAAKALLGDRLTEVITGLLTGGGTETTASGILYASGCVPHACGSADGFMAVDPDGKKVYFAREENSPQPSAWPPLDTWPAEVRDAMKTALEDSP